MFPVPVKPMSRSGQELRPHLGASTKTIIRHLTYYMIKALVCEFNNIAIVNLILELSGNGVTKNQAVLK